MYKIQKIFNDSLKNYADTQNLDYKMAVYDSLNGDDQNLLGIYGCEGNVKIIQDEPSTLKLLEINLVSDRQIENFVDSIRPGWYEHTQQGTYHFFDYPVLAIDGKQFNEAMIYELAQAWGTFLKSIDPAIKSRAQELYHQLRAEILKEMNK